MRTIHRGHDGLYHYLYKTTNIVNGKYYIGIHSTDDIDDGYLGSGVAFKQAVKKYGRTNFEKQIIKCFNNRHELSDAEFETVTMDIVQDINSYNMILGGDSGNGFTIGMVTVKDCDGKTCLMRRNDPRYLNGQYKFIRTDIGVYVDSAGNHINTSKHDPRVISGELVGVTKGKITARRVSDGQYVNINCLDPGLKNGTYVIDFINRNGRKEFRWVKKDGIVKSIHISELQTYLDDGWIIGNHHKGIKCITKNGQNKRVNLNELQTYLDDGWQLGTTQKYGHPSKSRGCKYIHKGSICKCVKPDELQTYLDDGWQLGMK